MEKKIPNREYSYRLLFYCFGNKICNYMCYILGKNILNILKNLFFLCTNGASTIIYICIYLKILPIISEINYCWISILLGKNFVKLPQKTFQYFCCKIPYFLLFTLECQACILFCINIIGKDIPSTTINYVVS